MSLLSDFIAARLADWESLARDATDLPQVTVKYPAKRPPWEPERWRVDRMSGDLMTVNGAHHPSPIDYNSGIRSREVAALMAEFDPAGVHALVDTLRAVLAGLDLVYDDNDDRWWGMNDIDAGRDMQLRDMALMMARHWSTHPDFRQEWAA